MVWYFSTLKICNYFCFNADFFLYFSSMNKKHCNKKILGWELTTLWMLSVSIDSDLVITEGVDITKAFFSLGLFFFQIYWNYCLCFCSRENNVFLNILNLFFYFVYNLMVIDVLFYCSFLWFSVFLIFQGNHTCTLHLCNFIQKKMFKMTMLCTLINIFQHWINIFSFCFF